MERTPDFFGNWMAGNPQVGAITSAALEGYGDFVMYIEKRESTSTRIEKIAGTIEDSYGLSTFEGELSEEEIKFMKTYSQDAIAKGAAQNGVRYHGRKYPDSFRGEFTVINRTVEGIKKDWTGEFYVIPGEVVRNN